LLTINAYIHMTQKPAPDADRLRKVNALLQVALSLPESEREPWLKTLPDHQQHLIPALSALLARASVETDDFLRQPINPFAGQAHGLRPGDEIGPYRLIRELGAGGMANVWLAERSDGLLRRQVAVKLPHEVWGPGLAQRMAQERNILAALEHPRIARLYDAGVTPAGKPWMAMEYVSGTPIDVFCTAQKLDVRQRLLLILQVFDAVMHAHARLIVHRDLKPTNILVTADGVVHLLDFGVAQLLKDDAATASNATQIFGRAATPEYASPEQVGGHPIGVASDIYSLGIVLYELLAGTRPYRLDREAAVSLEKAILSAEVPLASAQVAHNPKLAKQLRGDIDTILAKALKKDVRERYASVESFAADIRRHLDGEPVSARADGRWYKTKKFLRRHALPLSAAAAVVAALVLGLGTATWQAREALRQTNIARAQQARSQATADFTSMVLTEALRADETVTLDKLIERSENIADHDFSENPTERAVAVDTVADWLYDNDQYDRALQLLSHTIDSSGKSIDPTLLHVLRCQRAATRIGLGQISQAIEELDEVISVSGNDPETAWYCLQRRTAAALQISDVLGSQRYAREAMQQFERSGNSSQTRLAHLVANQAYAEMLNGRPAKADLLFRESVAQLEKAGHGESVLAESVYNDWAIALWNAGDPKAALDELDRGIKIVVSRSPSGEEIMTSYGNRGHTLRALGRFEEALASFERLRQLAIQSKNPSYEAYALAGQTIVAAQLGRVDAAQHYLEMGVDLKRRSELPDAGTPATWLLTAQAEVWRAQGKLTEADTQLSKLQAMRSKTAAKTGAVAETSINRADIAIAQKRFDDAEGHAKQALSIARQAQGDLPHSFMTGRAYLALAKSLQGKGSLDAAREASHQASENLRMTLGDLNLLSREADALEKELTS
jgi:eukaryotic-like serine/threonine-protein kinase